MIAERRIATSDLDEILDHAADDIRHFAGQRILITGGTGFVGKWLTASIDHWNARYQSRFHGVDYWATGSKEYNGRDWHAVIHGAPTEPINVGDKRLLYLSSGAVYFPDHRRDIAIEKIAGEAACARYPNAVIARLFSFLGPYLPQHYASTRILGGEAAENPTLIRSYLYPTDMVIALWAIFARGKPGEAYDVGSHVPTSLGYLQRVSLEEAVRRTMAFRGP